MKIKWILFLLVLGLTPVSGQVIDYEEPTTKGNGLYFGASITYHTTQFVRQEYDNALPFINPEMGYITGFDYRIMMRAGLMIRTLRDYTGDIAISEVPLSATFTYDITRGSKIRPYAGLGAEIVPVLTSIGFLKTLETGQITGKMNQTWLHFGLGVIAELGIRSKIGNNDELLAGLKYDYVYFGSKNSFAGDLGGLHLRINYYMYF